MQYTALKFYEGMTKFYWSVYLGKAPLEQTPVAVSISSAKLVVVQLFLLVAVVLTLVTVYFRNKWASTICFMVMSSAFFTAVLVHTENRYYLMAKIFCVLMLVLMLVGVSKRYWVRLSS